MKSAANNIMHVASYHLGYFLIKIKGIRAVCSCIPLYAVPFPIASLSLSCTSAYTITKIEQGCGMQIAAAARSQVGGSCPSKPVLISSASEASQGHVLCQRHLRVAAQSHRSAE